MGKPFARIELLVAITNAAQAQLAAMVSSSNAADIVKAKEVHEIAIQGVRDYKSRGHGGKGKRSQRSGLTLLKGLRSKYGNPVKVARRVQKAWNAEVEAGRRTRRGLIEAGRA